MKKIKVRIPSSECGYEITVSPGIAASELAEHAAKGGYTVADGRVAELYGHILGRSRLYSYEASEENKNLGEVENILIWLNENGAIRDSVLLALGGGITGDVAGFSAAVYMRGINVIQMPTTLLAMVDSSVGGKTGVNLAGIKNNVGAFHQPSKVVVDTDFLKTLPDDEYLNGLAEAIKIAAVRDKNFFDYLCGNSDAILARDTEAVVEVVARSCALKAEIVELDEKESDLRRLLNFGHTVAHAVETDSRHSVKHGFAVAVGMSYETLYAREKGYADSATFDKLTAALELFGFKTSYEPENRENFIRALSKDKKARKDGISLALTGENMEGKIIDGVKPEEIASLFFA